MAGTKAARDIQRPRNIAISDRIWDKVRREAERLGVSKSHLVRQALRAQFDMDNELAS